jgi:hypothetical protein
MLKTTQVALILSLSFFALSAKADSIRGFIQRQSGNHQLFVQHDDGSQVLVKMVGSSEQVQADINMLKNGDYLVARGSVANGTASVDSIESLGLQALVGAWSTEKSEVYEFEDFTRLTLYIPNAAGSLIVKAGEFQYSIAPDEGTRYQFFLSPTSGSATVGSLQFRKSHLVLNVIDPKTGQSSADIVLSPLAHGKH